MSLQIADVWARLGYREDDSGAKRYERRLQGLRHDASHEVVAKAGVDVDGKGFQQYEKRLKKADRDGLDFRTSLSGHMGHARAAVFGLQAFVAGATIAMGKSFADLASDVNESLSKNRVLFGDYAKDVERFADRSAKSYGISKRAALEYTGVFGNLTRAIGVSQKDSADIAVRLTKQAADMASFNNTTIEDALEALRSGLVGETEPLRKFGVTLNANSVAAEAMSMGLVKVTKTSYEVRKAQFDAEKALEAHTKATKEHGATSTEARGTALALEAANMKLNKAMKGGGVELTSQQKQQATLALITRQTAAAQGDFARTSSGAANQGRIFSARLEDLRTKAGKFLLPIMIAVTKALNQFVDGAENGTGAGGKFVEIMNRLIKAGKDVASTVSSIVHFFREHRDATTALLAVSSALVAGFAAFKIVETVRKWIEAAKLAFIGLNLVMTANPAGLIVAGIAALAAGLYILYKRSETARTVMNAVWTALKQYALSYVQVQLKAIDLVLLGFQKLAEAASHLPGVGGKFRALADSIQGARDHIQGWQDDIHDFIYGSDGAGGATDRQREKIHKLSDAYEDARKKQEGLRKGTDAYRAAANEARKRANALVDAIADAGTAATNARKPIGTLRGNIQGLGDASHTTADAVIADLNAALRGLGAKPVNIKVTRHGASGVFGTPDIGGLPGKATGGIPNPGAGARDDHILIDRGGRPVAAMSGTEGILNTPQMGIVDFALAYAHGSGMIPWGGLNDLWASGMRHYAGGGTLARANALDKMALPYVWGGHHGDRGPITDPHPGLDCSSAASYVLGIPPRVSGQFMNYGMPGPGPVSIYANPDHVFLSLWGRGFGTSAENPGGGPGWLSYNQRPGFTVRHVSGSGGFSDVGMPKISGPAGPLRDIVTGGAGKLVKAANGFLMKQLGGLDFAGGQPLREGRLTVPGMAKLFTRHGGASGDAHTMGAIGMAESGGDPNAVGPPTPWGRAKGWAQILGQLVGGNLFNPDVNAANAVAKWRGAGRTFRPWEAFTNGRFRQFLNLGGALRRFAGGGPLRPGPAAGTRGPGYVVPGLNSTPQYSIRSLRRQQGDRIGDYDDVLGELEDTRKIYEQTDRRFGQTEEVYIDPKTGMLNQTAIDRRATELARLLRLREKIVRLLHKAQAIAKRVISTYTTIIGRLTRSLKHAKKKDRSGIRSSIEHYTDNRGEWRDKLHDLGFDITDAELDVGDIKKEGNELRGMISEPTDIASGSDAGAGDTGTSDSSGSGPDPDLQAVADQARASAAAAIADLNALRQNMTAFTSPGDLAYGGANAFDAARFGTLGGGWLPGSPSAGGGADGIQHITVVAPSFVTPTGPDLQRMAGAVAAAIDSAPTRPRTTERLG